MEKGDKNGFDRKIKQSKTIKNLAFTIKVVDLNKLYYVNM